MCYVVLRAMKLKIILVISIVILGCGADNTAPPGHLIPDENGVTIPEKYHRGLPIEAWGEVDGNGIMLDEESRVFSRLKSEGIKYEVLTYRGFEFLVWEEKDDFCVQKIFNNHFCK